MACGAACSLVPLAATFPSNPSGNVLLVRDLVGPAWQQRGLVGLVRKCWWPVQLRRGAVSWRCFQRGRGFCRAALRAKRRPDVEKRDLNELWGLFGLSPTADRAEVRKRYREIVATEHPDKRPDDPQAAQKFRQITLAYGELVKAVERGDRPMQTSGTSRSDTVDQYFEDWELELFRVAREGDFEVVAPMSDAEVLQATAAGQEADGFESFAETEQSWRPTGASDEKVKPAAGRGFMSSENSRSWSEEQEELQSEKRAAFFRNTLLMSFAGVAASILAASISLPRL